MGRFIEKGKTALVATASGGVGFTLAGLLLRDWNFSWDWSVAAQPLATLGAGTAAIIAAAIALHNGEKTREQDKERTLRERFTSIVELLATDDLTKRESGAYALAALAGDWAAFYKDDPESALREQQVCLNILTGQLRDPILKDSPSELYTFKERIQDIIFTRFEERNGKSPGQWSDLNLNLENCHFYNISSKGIFKNRASFTNSHFHGRTSFTGAHFYDNTLFKSAHFCKHADFNRAHFNIRTPLDPNDHYRTYVDFSGTNFHDSVSFIKTIFHSGATFDGAHFNSNTPPRTATVFITDATFDLAHFYGIASFFQAYV
ncbi:pentapeptide repeat-containing protein, partial [Corynebacterium durum]|uniref:pentapeptide repeat-containing protein n=1 Tax=Corynebacterium durum TaxID=61592 RepID=UPI0036F3AA97